jgi:hypothetical protein
LKSIVNAYFLIWLLTILPVEAQEARPEQEILSTERVLTAVQKLSHPFSMFQIEAFPERFEGKEVAVDGYLAHSEGNSTVLYLSKEYAEHFMYGGAMYLQFSKKGPWVQACFGTGKQQRTETRKIDLITDYSSPVGASGCYVTVIGTFHRDDRALDQGLTNVWYVRQHSEVASDAAAIHAVPAAE